MLRKKLYARFRNIGYTKSMALFLSNELYHAGKVFNFHTSPCIISTNKSGKLKQDVRTWNPLEKHIQL